MKNAASPVIENVQAFRKSRSETQADFWKRFGLTQPGGSRYESGQPIPTPTAILLDLFAQGTVSETELAASLKRVRESANIDGDAPPRRGRGRPTSD